MNNLKTSEEWNKILCKKLGIQYIILDPDGWDRMNFQKSFHEELITKSEFTNRLMKSTLNGLPLDIDEVIEKL
jgi:hypothetical protein